MKGMEFLENLAKKVGQTSRMPAYVAERTGLSDFVQGRYRHPALRWH